MYIVLPLHYLDPTYKHQRKILMSPDDDEEAYLYYVITRILKVS